MLEDLYFEQSSQVFELQKFHFGFDAELDPSETFVFFDKRDNLLGYSQILHSPGSFGLRAFERMYYPNDFTPQELEICNGLYLNYIVSTKKGMGSRILNQSVELAREGIDNNISNFVSAIVEDSYDGHRFFMRQGFQDMGINYQVYEPATLYTRRM